MKKRTRTLKVLDSRNLCRSESYGLSRRSRALLIGYKDSWHAEQIPDLPCSENDRTTARFLRREDTLHSTVREAPLRAISPVQRAPAPLPLAPLRAHVRRPRRAPSSARRCRRRRRRRWHMVARPRGRRPAAAIGARISPHPPHPLSRGRRPRRHRLPAARRGDARPGPRRAPSLRRPCPWPRAAATRERGWRWRRCPRRGAAAARAAPVVRVKGEGWGRG